MNELLAMCAALASLTALCALAQTTPTRAWGEPTSGRLLRLAWFKLGGTLLLQLIVLTFTAGWVAAMLITLSSWMLLGWVLVLLMNQWPSASMRWGRRLGLIGMLGVLSVWPFASACAAIHG